LEVADVHCCTPIWHAASRGDEQIARALLAARADANRACAYGATPLYRAALYGHVPILALLLAPNPDVVRANVLGCTPLHVAANGGCTSGVGRLLKAKADVNSTEDGHARRTALQLAAGHGYVSVVKQLLEAKADANVADANGDTPVVAAACAGSARSVLCLVDAKGRVDAFRDGESTLMRGIDRAGFRAVLSVLLMSKVDYKTNAQAS
jgi:ankyrin repeat protein